nr:exodeoxyribonuclease VII large subunit [Legionella jordanis]
MQSEVSALSVSQLNRQIRFWLENEVGDVAVIGELSNLSKPGSGHFYFSLKDETAQLRCVYFRNYHKTDSKLFKDGQQVLAKGRLSLYEARGDYQLIVHSLSDAGLGELYRRFEELKEKLKAQGLFDAQKKKAIPRFPSAIGVVTSKNGAALHDILTTLARRYPLAQVKVYPSEVQGKDAAPQLIKAIERANRIGEVEVLILARGGGSMEDLWAFNDETLALTISRSHIPVVSGVGHETDFTIADFVADLRAATPTAAAEAVTPNKLELLASIRALQQRAIASVLSCTRHKQLLLSNRMAKISSPQQLIAKHWQTLDFLERQLHQCLRSFINRKNNSINLLMMRLEAKNPKILLQQWSIKTHNIEQRLTQTMKNRLQSVKQEFTSQLATLHAVSPLATLDRGYAIASFKQHVLFGADQVKKGDTIHVRLAKGELECEVCSAKE